LADLSDRRLDLVANATAHAVDHINSFFDMLRLELAFYVGCLNLHERLDRLGAPSALPAPLDQATSNVNSSVSTMSVSH
jgi:hypothetical protein